MGREAATIATRRHADSEALYRTAVAIRRGLPLWELGYDDRPWREWRSDRPAEIIGTPVLHLATGLLDERRRQLAPGHKAYEQFVWALRWQDTWSPDEHAGFWNWALDLWPSAPKPRHRDALAFAVAFAVEALSEHRRSLDQTETYPPLGDLMTGSWWDAAAEDLERFSSRLGVELERGPAYPGLQRSHCELGDLERLGVLAVAHEMLVAPRHNLRRDGRLPRVSTDANPPLIALQFAPFSEHSTAGDGSYAIRRAAITVIDQMKRELTAAA